MMDILIVDDDHEDCEVLAEAIFELNSAIKTRRVSNGAAALTFLHYEPTPALIFLDGRLNGMTAQELLKKFAGHDAWKNIPVIMYSGFTASEMRNEFLSLGAAEFVSKTGDYGKLKEDLKRIIVERAAMLPGGSESKAVTPGC